MKSILVIAVASAFIFTGCGGSAPHDYSSDLENTVALEMRRGFDDEELLRRIDIVARRHDVNDWRSADESFVAIGTGLREAGVEPDAAEAVADLVSGGDSRSRDLVVDAFGG